MQHPRTAARSDRLLRTISVGSLAFFGGAIMAVALARGRWHLALGAGAVIVGANVTTEVFKALAPPAASREQPADLVQHAAQRAQHRRRVARRRARAGGPGPAPAVGGDARRPLRRWHRGDDARGRLAPPERRGSAFAVVGIWTFGVSAILVARRGTGAPRAPEGLPGLVVGAVLVLGTRVRASSRCRPRSTRPTVCTSCGSDSPTCVALLSIVVVAVAFMLSEVLLLRHVSLDRPSVGRPSVA